jgi:hypothetical protein
VNNVENVISQLENQRSAIDRAILALREATGTAPASEVALPNGDGAPRKRRLSPEGRRRIIEATKKRWAAQRSHGTTNGQKPALSAPRHKGGVISPAGRKRLAVAMKKRWAAAKKAGRASLS